MNESDPRASTGESAAAIDAPCVGIVDWGIGGLGFYRLLKRKCPNVVVDYLSDAGTIPYGRMSPRALRHRIDGVIGYFRSRGVRRVVVACNAASREVARRQANRDRVGGNDVTVVGIIDAAVASVRIVSPATVGVIGGAGTIRSGIYRRALSSFVPVVIQRVAQPLSAFVERGEVASAALDAELERILHPLRDTDAVLMACTHYPAIAASIHHYLPAATLIDPAVALCDQVVRGWRLSDLAPARVQQDLFATTGDVDTMRRSAQRAFGVRLHEIQRVSLTVDRADIHVGGR